MKVTILGSGTGIPSLKRGSPGLVVTTGGSVILFDSGSGTVRRLLEAQVTLLDLDYIFYSHLHPDHTVDLVSLLFALRNPELRRTKSLFIGGPPGFLEFYQALRQAYGHWVEPLGYELTTTELNPGEATFGEFKLTSARVAHPGFSLGFRLEGADGSLAYSGDSEYCDSLIQLGRGVDLLILECSFPDDQPCPGHLTPSGAGRIAAQAGCQRLLLTHFYPACEGRDLLGPCRKSFSGEVLLAHDLLTLTW